MDYSGLWFISSHGYLDLMFWDLFFHTKTPEMGGWVLPKAKCFFLAKKDDFNRGCFWSLSFGWNYIDLYVKDCEFELMSDEPFWEKKCCMCEYAKKKGHNMLLTPKTNNNNSNAVQLMDCDGLCMISTFQDSLYRISVTSMWVLQLPNPSRSLLYRFFLQDPIPTCMIGRWVSA